MNEVSELQQKRAVNIIWNGAGNYGFAPDFKAYDDQGRAESREVIVDVLP